MESGMLTGEIAGQYAVILLPCFLTYTVFKRCFAFRQQSQSSRLCHLFADSCKELVIFPKRYRTALAFCVFTKAGIGLLRFYNIVAAARAFAQCRKFTMSATRYSGNLYIL